MLIHNAYGYGLFTGGLGAHYGAERLGCTVVPASGGMTERQVQLIQDFRPDMILVTPSYLLALEEAFAASGLDPRKTSLKYAVLGAEPWTEAMRAAHRGRHEPQRDRHLRPLRSDRPRRRAGERRDQGRAAYLGGPFSARDRRSRDRRVLPDGEIGELVFTSLTKEAFPVVRYRTRDLTRLMPGTARPGMRRMEKVTGRTDDMMIVRGVNLFPSQIEEALLATPWSSGHFLIELSATARSTTCWCGRKRMPRIGTATG